MRKVYTCNEKLKYARELRGWSQEELARRMGSLADNLGRQGVFLDVSTISRWERGRNSPSPFYRQLLCSLFEMNAEELGLLLPDNLPSLVENTFGEQEYGSSESEANAPTLPMAVVYAPENHDADMPAFIVQNDRYQDETVFAAVRSNSAPYFLPTRRRDLLVALLASATLGGGAAVVIKLFLSRPKPTVPIVAATPTVSRQTTVVTPKVPSAPVRNPRHWPKVTPDSHKTLARVRVIQWMLNAHGWQLQVDGVFWENTENAVISFQKETKLPVTSTVGSLTWEQLMLTSNLQVVYQGDRVKALQEILNTYGTSPRLDVDGDFGPLTEVAIKHFQQTHKIAVTGQADLNTWCVLVGGSLS